MSDINNQRFNVSIKMKLKPAQFLAMKAMLEYWNWCSAIGASRYVSFFVDGDGDFHPSAEIDVSSMSSNNAYFFVPPELTDQLRNAAVVADDAGNRTYDYDPIAWLLHHD